MKIYKFKKNTKIIYEFSTVLSLTFEFESNENIIIFQNKLYSITYNNFIDLTQFSKDDYVENFFILVNYKQENIDKFYKELRKYVENL